MALGRRGHRHLFEYRATAFLKSGRHSGLKWMRTPFRLLLHSRTPRKIPALNRLDARPAER